jgi:anti-anti-sigma factor
MDTDVTAPSPAVRAGVQPAIAEGGQAASGGRHDGRSPAVRRVRPPQTVRLSGQVDVRTVGNLRSRLDAAIECGTGLLRVDVAGLELTDDAGLGVLLGGARRARRAGRSMVLVDVPAGLGRLLAAHRLHGMLGIEYAADLAHCGHA